MFKNKYKKNNVRVFLTIVLFITLSFSVIGFTLSGKKSNSCKLISWPSWNKFKSDFISEDGRVIDNNPSSELTTSEGQSYGLFFALVNNDQILFDKIWNWTSNNLMQGDIRNLPAWSWGEDKKTGKFGILDKNSASDSDLWISYALLEAGRIWGDDKYTQAGKNVLNNIESLEVSEIPSLGPMLLPGRFGFVSEDKITWELNPSYLPIFLLRYMDKFSSNGNWGEIIFNTLRMINESSPKGVVPEWVSFQINHNSNNGYFFVNQERGVVSSYNSIRVYLWAGMINKKDPLRDRLLTLTNGMANAIERIGYPPEEVSVSTGQGEKASPYGFSAAVLPYLMALGKNKSARDLYASASSSQLKTTIPENKETNPAFYYDYVLSLFGMGHFENRFRFLANGKLELPWLEQNCKLTN